MSKERNAVIIATGKSIKVYKHSERNTYVSMLDYDTEYKPNELKF